MLTIMTDSRNAHRLLATMQVGILRGGCEVEIWKAEQDVDLLGEN